MNQAIIGSDNGLLPVRHQAIISTDVGLLSIGSLGTNFSEISINHFFEEIAFENVIWKIVANLFQPQFVNDDPVQWHMHASFGLNWLDLKHWEKHGCEVSTVATDALVLKHQAINILSTD